MTGEDFGSHFLREKNKRSWFIVPLGPGRPDICQNFGGCRVQKKLADIAGYLPKFCRPTCGFKILARLPWNLGQILGMLTPGNLPTGTLKFQHGFGAVSVETVANRGG